MDVLVPGGIKYTIINDGDTFQPQKEYGNRELYPAFDTLRDAIIFMERIESDFIPGITGNVQIIKK